MPGDAEQPVGPLTRPATRTFFGAPAVDDLDRLDARVAFLGVPTDQGVIIPFIRSGAFAGPRLVRETRTRLRESRPDGASAGWFDIETERHYLEGVRLADCGDVLIAGGDMSLSQARTTAAARKIAERGAMVVAVGGDHSISFPVGRGVAEAHQMVDVVHIDAHPDFADSIYGSKLQHGSQLRRLFDLPTTKRFTALGLRSVDRDQYEDMKRLGVAFASTRAILEEGPRAVVDRLVQPAEKLYVSIDIDVLDSGLVPGTTLPEPGGIAYRQLRELLATVATKGQIVGFDVVETSAAQADLATAMTSAWLIIHFLTAILAPDGRVVHLTEGWSESPDPSTSDAVSLRRDMVVRSADGKRLGRLRLVCFDRASATVTGLVVAGRGKPDLRLLPIERVREAGPNGIVTDLPKGEWARLPTFATDWDIKQAFTDQLMADPALRALQRSVTIEVQDQVVTLRGYVVDQSEAERVARVIRSVPGVMQVDRKLITDDDMGRAVTDAIRSDAVSSAAEVQVSAHRGTV